MWPRPKCKVNVRVKAETKEDEQAKSPQRDLLLRSLGWSSLNPFCLRPSGERRGVGGGCPASSPTSRGRRTRRQVKADVLARGRGTVAISRRKTKQEEGGESMCLHLGAAHITRHRKAVVEGIDSQL